MKPPVRTMRRITVRIKPGGLLRIPLRFLRGSGWRSGDVVICEAFGDSIHLFKPPTETVCRIERLRRRLNPVRADDLPAFAARNCGEYRRMIRSGSGARLINIRRNPR